MKKITYDNIITVIVGLGPRLSLVVVGTSDDGD